MTSIRHFLYVFLPISLHFVQILFRGKSLTVVFIEIAGIYIFESSSITYTSTVLFLLILYMVIGNVLLISDECCWFSISVHSMVSLNSLAENCVSKRNWVFASSNTSFSPL